MSPVSDSGPAAVARPSSLSTKITVIVFWGLSIGALFFAAFLLTGLEQATVQRREALADGLAHRLQNTLSRNGGLAPLELDRELERIKHVLDVSGAQLHLQDRMIAHAGEVATDADRLRRSLPYPDGTAAQLTIAFPALDDTVHAERSRLLLGLGALFLVFGVALRKVLERVISKPMERMVETARAMSLGAVDLRFDDDRRDDFGYLARFINDALNEIRESQAESFRARELAEVTLHSIGDGVITTDPEGRVHYANPVAQRLLGKSLAELQDQPLPTVMPIVDENTGVAVEHPIRRCLEDGRTVELDIDCAVRLSDGTIVPINDSAAPIRDHAGAILGGVVVFHDVSATRALQRELSYHASHDPLTGLFNRREFERELQRALEACRHEGRRHVLCYLDLDQFKVVNDTCGHMAGDSMLRSLGEYLEQRVGASDVLARLGGDEFGVLLTDCALEQAMDTAARLREAIAEFRFAWDDKVFQVGVSIGVVELTAGTTSIGEVLSAADMACYAAKEEGRNRVHAYRPGDETLARRRSEMALVTQIRSALVEERLHLYCQPIVALAADVSGMDHYEVLVRMTDADGGLVSPGVFIPAAERYQLMSTIDRWVVGRAVAFLRERHVAGQPLALSINLSGQSLSEEKFLEFVVNAVTGEGVPTERICFEITETAAIANLNRAMHFMTVLRDLGCCFALDDFGSGLSSFAYLRNLPVDYLKIDGVFVRQLETSSVDRAMVQAINQVGHELGMKTIAEFVENEAIHRVLAGLGVDYVQGYGVGRPHPIEELAGVWDRSANRSATAG